MYLAIKESMEWFESRLDLSDQMEKEVWERHGRAGFRLVLSLVGLQAWMCAVPTGHAWTVGT